MPELPGYDFPENHLRISNTTACASTSGNWLNNKPRCPSKTINNKPGMELWLYWQEQT
jgi:hypothetical protein